MPRIVHWRWHRPEDTLQLVWPLSCSETNTLRAGSQGPGSFPVEPFLWFLYHHKEQQGKRHWDTSPLLIFIQLSTSVFICGQFLMSVISNSTSADILLLCFGLYHEWIYVSIPPALHLILWLEGWDNFRIMGSTLMLLLVAIFVESP